MDYRRPAALAALFLMSGCSSTVTAHTTAAAKPLPAGCAAALRVLPSSAPDTAQQAANDLVAIGTAKGTTLDALMAEVFEDAGQIGLILDGSGGNMTATVAAFESDSSAVRTFCRDA